MRKQFVVLAALLCLFVAVGEMQGLPQDPAVTVYVSGPSAHTIYTTTWEEACEGGTFAGEMFVGGSQFRPTGIEYGSDNLIYFTDASHSEIGRVSLDGLEFEIISDASISTLENPTDIIFLGTDALVSSRAGSRKSKAGLFIIDGIASIPINAEPPVVIPLPESLAPFGSGGGSSAESLAILYDRALVGTESSDAEVLVFPYNNPVDPYTAAAEESSFQTFVVPMGIAGTGVAVQEKIYVGFPKTGEIVKYDRTNPEAPGVLFAVLPDRYKPRHIETDLAGNVYVAASRQSSGANGALFCIPPDHTGGGAPLNPAVPLDSAFGVAVGAGSSVTSDPFRIPEIDPDNPLPPGEKLCGDEIILGVEGGDAITVTLTCTDITPQEFRDQLDQTIFPNAKCIPEPGKKSCTLITITEADGSEIPTELVTQFIRTMVPFVDFTTKSTDAGILFRHGPTELFRENILRQLEIVNWGFDPGRLTGRRDNFGSDLVFCTDCDTSPVVYAGEDQKICEGDELTLSGTVEDFQFIEDFIHPGTNDWLDVRWQDENFSDIPTDWDAEYGNVAIGKVSNMAAGFHTFTLTAHDGTTIPGSDEVIVEVTADDQPPVFTASATPDMLWPPNHEMTEVLIDVVTKATCTDLVTCKVTNISFNDFDDNLGDGSTSDDYYQTGDLTVMVRAERNQAKGKLGQETDRVYTIEVTCTNNAAPSGANEAVTTVTVTVLEDQGDSGN